MSNEDIEISALTSEVALEASEAVIKVLARYPNHPSEKAAAALEASVLAAMRVVVEMGCPWQEALWALRTSIQAIEKAHVALLRAKMAEKVGEPKPGEENTALQEAEQSLIQIETGYTSKRPE